MLIFYKLTYIFISKVFMYVWSPSSLMLVVIGVFLSTHFSSNSFEISTSVGTLIWFRTSDSFTISFSLTTFISLSIALVSMDGTAPGFSFGARRLLNPIQSTLVMNYKNKICNNFPISNFKFLSKSSCLKCKAQSFSLFI